MSAPTRIRTILPALSGRGVLLAAPADADRIRRALASAGWTVTETDVAGPPLGPGQPDDTLDAESRRTSLRAAQEAIARALRLPDTAGRNLDALVDSLRDLSSWWPEDRQVALFLHRAESLVESDLPGWHTLVDILETASAQLWQDGGTGDRILETVALVAGHGVLALPEEPAEQAQR